MPSAPTLSAQALSRNYGPHAAVRAVSFELCRGEVLGFLGPNGAGKSTTMQMLAGNLAPSAGRIEICGIDLLDRPRAAKALLGFLPETPPLYREMTVDGYLRFAARLHRLPQGEVAAAVGRVKERCGLAEVGRRLVGRLSKGYQQRVGIAQAIVHNPQVVILDEPTVGLDPIQIREIRALIRQLGGEHSVILSTHILPEIEGVCDRVQLMHRGQLVFSGTVEEMRQQRRSDTWILALHRPPEAGALLALPGVDQVEPLAEGQFRLHCGAEAGEEIAQAAAAHDWGLHRLQPEPASLEDVFVHLTQQEEP